MSDHTPVRPARGFDEDPRHSGRPSWSLKNGPRGLRRTGIAAIVAVTTLTGATLLSPAAQAATTHLITRLGAAPSGVSGAAPAMNPAMTSVVTTPPADAAPTGAAAMARASGTPQVVTDLTTSTSQTVVNPDGTFTQTQNILPVRVQAAGTWVPVDLTLHVAPDGSIQPVAAPVPVTFSGGGTSALVSMPDDHGHTLTARYGTTLPTPVLDGPTATYPDVMPGVDLVLTATATGGFSEVLAVKTAAAAGNPALADVVMDVTTPGLTLTSNPTTGALSATDSAGTTHFDTPTPLMWDSTLPTTATNPAPTPMPAPGDDPVVSDASGPGVAADTARLPATLGVPSPGGSDPGDTRSVHVHPNPAMLTSASTVFPVYIDPYYAPYTTGRQHFTWVQQGCSNTSNYDSTVRDPGAGLNGYSGCVGIERTFFQMDTAPLAGATIASATLNTQISYSAKGCPANAYPFTAAPSDGFSPGTTWNNQPGLSAGYAADTEQVTACQGQGPVNVNFNVLGSVQQAALHGYPSATYRITGNEGDMYGWKRFNNNPSLTVTYDRAPATPTGLTLTPAPLNGYIGATNVVTAVTMAANVSSPVPGQSVRGVFTLNDATAGTAPVNGAATGFVSGSGRVSVQAPASALVDGHRYTWNVYANDNILNSAAAAGAGFIVDATPPTITGVASTDYPKSTSAVHTTLHAGAAGKFQLAATDTAPAGGTPSGVARIDWQLNTPFGGAGAPANTAISGNTPGNATISPTPTEWGTNILYVRTLDKAGNISQTQQYLFYVPTDPTAVATLGDLTGDKAPDILTVDTSGNLRVFPGSIDPVAPISPTNENPLTGPYLASLPTDAPDDTSWTGALVTHYGSFTSNSTVDDIFAWKNGYMALYSNISKNASWGHFSSDASSRSITLHPKCGSCGSMAGGPWPTLTALVAPGDVVGNADPADATKYADLVTIENGHLWIYPGGIGKGLGEAVMIPNPTTIDLAHADLIAPGDVNHDGHPDLWIRNTLTGSITQLNGNGTNFDTPTTVATGGFTADSFPSIVSDRDITGDGKVDLITLTRAGTLERRTVPTTLPASSAAFTATPIAPATFIAGTSTTPGITALENQTVAPTRNVYVPVTPTRLVDTRNNQNGGTLTNGVRRAWTVTGTSNVPATGVTAVALSVTGLDSSQTAYIRFGDNGPGTATSTINLPAALPVANSAIVVPDAQGQISAVLGGGTADVLIDVVGYYTSQDDATTAGVTGSYYVPLPGSRVCDSRTTTGNAPGCGQLAAGVTRTVTIAGNGGVPAGATAVTINIATPVSPARSAVVAWAAGQPQPGTSTLNPNTGETVSATAQVQLSADGQLNLWSSNGTQNVLLDIQGYYLPTTATPVAGASTYVPVPPARILNTNDPGLSGTDGTPLASGATRTLKITGALDSNGNAVTPPAGACAAAVEIGVTGQGAAGFLQAGPQGVTVPTSTLNYPATPARANMAITKLSADGSIDIRNFGGTPTDVYVDLIGYLTPQNGTC